MNDTEFQDLSIVEIVEDKLYLIYKNNVLTSEAMWINNPSVMAATRVGLWVTCLDMPRDQYEKIIVSLDWLGPQCISHQYKLLSDNLRTPQWFKVMNISISCCVTCLIILTGTIGFN